MDGALTCERSDLGMGRGDDLEREAAYLIAARVSCAAARRQDAGERVDGRRDGVVRRLKISQGREIQFKGSPLGGDPHPGWGDTQVLAK